MNPTIKDAKDLCTRYRKRGMVIVSFESGTFHCSSYGFDRRWCDRMRFVVEQFAGFVEAGVIEIPELDGWLKFDPVAEAGEQPS